MLYVANAGAMPLRARRHCEELVSWVTRLVLCDALVSCKQPTTQVSSSWFSHSPLPKNCQSMSIDRPHQINRALVAVVCFLQTTFTREHLMGELRVCNDYSLGSARWASQHNSKLQASYSMLNITSRAGKQLCLGLKQAEHSLY